MEVGRDLLDAHLEPARAELERRLGLLEERARELLKRG
jgi:hypothetical protein